MLRLVISFVVLACAAMPLAAQVHDSYVFDRHYRAEVRLDSLKASPMWADDADDPPLSARKAIAVAEKIREPLVGDIKDWKWSVASASLERSRSLPNTWYWLVTFNGMPREGGIFGGNTPDLHVPVPMNGVAIKPELVRPKARPEPSKRKQR